MGGVEAIKIQDSVSENVIGIGLHINAGKHERTS
jgi:hypothetical protein